VKRRFAQVGVVGAVVLSVTLAACSSSSKSTSSSSAAASAPAAATSASAALAAPATSAPAAATSAPAVASSAPAAASSAPASSGSALASGLGGSIPYNGPEANLGTITVPNIVAGTKCSIGYQTIIGSVPAQKAEQDAAGAEAKRLGCSYTALDDQVTPTTQVNNFNQLVAQKVNAILVFPIVASALTPSLAKAKAAGIFVIGQSAPIAADSAPIPGYATDGLHMSDIEAYLRVKSIATKSPGATFVEMGLAAPVELLQYYAARTKYWAAKFGLKYLGEIDAPQDDPASYASSMSAILGKYPNTQAVFTFSDNSAVGAAAVADSSGKSSILISGGDGSANAITQIKAGKVFNTPQPDFLLTGKLMVDAAYDEITKQNLPLPEKFGVPVKLIDQSNAASASAIG
jgi:ribose transport system substrate-binding protein